MFCHSSFLVILVLWYQSSGLYACREWMRFWNCKKHLNLKPRDHCILSIRSLNKIHWIQNTMLSYLNILLPPPYRETSFKWPLVLVTPAIGYLYNIPLQVIDCWCEIGSRMHGHEAALEMLTIRIRHGFLKRTPQNIVLGIYHCCNRKLNKIKGH